MTRFYSCHVDLIFLPPSFSLPLTKQNNVGMFFALLLISMTFLGDGDSGSGFAIFGLALYLSFFSIGMGPGKDGKRN